MYICIICICLYTVFYVMREFQLLKNVIVILKSMMSKNRAYREYFKSMNIFMF